MIWLAFWLSLLFVSSPPTPTCSWGQGSICFLLPKYLKQRLAHTEHQNFCGMNEWIEKIRISTSCGLLWSFSELIPLKCLAHCQHRVNTQILTSDIDFVTVKSHYEVLQCPVIVWLNHNANYKSSPAFRTWNWYMWALWGQDPHLLYHLWVPNP